MTASVLTMLVGATHVSDRVGYLAADTFAAVAVLCLTGAATRPPKCTSCGTTRRRRRVVLAAGVAEDSGYVWRTGCAHERAMVVAHWSPRPSSFPVWCKHHAGWDHRTRATSRRRYDIA